MLILVTARSQQGKTYFCRQFLKHVSAAYFNNDDVRKQTANHDFSMNGRLLAAQNMRQLINQSFAEIKIVDIISPDVIVFIDSDKPSKYPDTDALYVRPTKDEAKYFFSCWTRKVGELVLRMVSFLKDNV